MTDTRPSAAQDDNHTNESVEWQDAIKESPFLFVALLFALGIVVLLACMFIYLLGLSNNAARQPTPLPTTTLQFATSTPIISSGSSTPDLGNTPIPNQAHIDVISVQGESGMLVTVTGQDWNAGDVLIVRIDALNSSQPLQPLFANVQVTSAGTFLASFILPASSGWNGLASILVTVESSNSGETVSGEFSLEDSAPLFTPTPTPTDIPPPPPDSTPTPTTVYMPTQGDWLGEYYANPNLVGHPRMVRQDQGINFDWGQNSPHVALPPDGFSVRWTQSLGLELAVYRFHLRATDGVRLWINEQLIIDEWFASLPREIFVDYPTAYQGSHNIRIEYVNFSGPAQISFWREKIAVPPPPGNPPPLNFWRGDYYPNATLAGNPSFGRNDPELNFNWGSGPAAPGLPSNNYSVRWIRLADFTAENYRFYLKVKDGAKLWVDDKLLIDEWREGEIREVSQDMLMTEALHELRVEFFKKNGDGLIQLRWERGPLPTVTPSPTATPINNYPDWKGEYWANVDLSGDSMVVRNDPHINFSWGLGPPDSAIPADNFSVRWSRSNNFTDGLYRFTAEVKEGIRFYIDDNLVLNQWSDSAVVRTHVLDLNLSGNHNLKVEYYHRNGEAVAKFGWQQLLVTPTLVPTLTPTHTPIPIPTLVPTLTPTLIPTPIPTLTLTFTPIPDTPTPIPETSTPLPTATETSTITATATITDTDTP